MKQTITTLIVSALTTTASHAQDAIYTFEWLGAGGYVMRGALAFDPSLIGEGLVFETDLSCFAIEGERNGASLGQWSLGRLNEETTWMLTFDPVASAFVVWSPQSPFPQAWNMDGIGKNCGTPGFGFNIGDYAQDLCVNGQLQRESQMPPSTPFLALRDDDFSFPPDACIGPLLMSQLNLNRP